MFQFSRMSHSEPDLGGQLVNGAERFKDFVGLWPSLTREQRAVAAIACPRVDFGNAGLGSVFSFQLDLLLGLDIGFTGVQKL